MNYETVERVEELVLAENYAAQKEAARRLLRPLMLRFPTQESEIAAGYAARLREALVFVASTVHRAHHDGLFAECPKNTCDAARQALSAEAA